MAYIDNKSLQVSVSGSVSAVFADEPEKVLIDYQEPYTRIKIRLILSKNEWENLQNEITNGLQKA